MTLPKQLEVKVNNYAGRFILSDFYCPNCGNQTMYFDGNQTVAYTCVNCGCHWQLRENTKPDTLEIHLLNSINIEDVIGEMETLPVWSDL